MVMVTWRLISGGGWRASTTFVVEPAVMWMFWLACWKKPAYNFTGGNGIVSFRDSKAEATVTADNDVRLPTSKERNSSAIYRSTRSHHCPHNFSLCWNLFPTVDWNILIVPRGIEQVFSIAVYRREAILVSRSGRVPKQDVLWAHSIGCTCVLPLVGVLSINEIRGESVDHLVSYVVRRIRKQSAPETRFTVHLIVDVVVKPMSCSLALCGGISVEAIKGVRPYFGAM